MLNGFVVCAKVVLYVVGNDGRICCIGYVEIREKSKLSGEEESDL